MINPAVADVAEIHPSRREPAQAHRGFHPVTFLIRTAEINQRAMDLREQLRQHVGKAGIQSAGRLLEGARQQRRDFFGGDLAGIFARLGAAHAVAHGKGEVVFLQRSLAKFPQPENLPRIKLEAEKGILVVLAHPAGVRAAGPLQNGRSRAGVWFRMIHFGPGLDSGKMVANSKSIKQKRPSDCPSDWR